MEGTQKKPIFKLLKNLLFFIGLVVLTFWLIFKDQDMLELYKIVNSVDKKYIIFGIMMMLGYYLTESYNIKCMVKVLENKKISIFSAFKYTLIGFFFSSITPSSSGGQAVEIYYMNKDGISYANATMALLIHLCGLQISIILLGVVGAIIYPVALSNVLWLFILGIILNGIVLSIILIGVFSHTLSQKLVQLYIKILKLFKVKNIDEKATSLNEGLQRYHEGAEFIKSNKIEFIKSVTRVVIQLLIYHSVTFFVYRAFGLSDYNYWQITAIQAVFFTSVSGLPLPGAIGASEAVFLKIYDGVFSETLLSGAMLLSRGIMFYLFIVISLVVVLINAFKTKDLKIK